MRNPAALAIACLCVAAGCSSLRYDLTPVPFPVSASPAPMDAKVEVFETTRKSVLWVHGLFGESNPDVAEVVRISAEPCLGVANFRVTVAASFHDWLVTHLTLGFVRMKTVTVTGERMSAR